MELISNSSSRDAQNNSLPRSGIGHFQPLLLLHTAASQSTAQDL